MMRRALPLLVLTFLSGCTHWVKDETVLQTPIPEREPVEIFSGTGSVVAHSVRVDSTTLSYIPRIVPSECDSCRRTIPLAAVDSVRTSAISAPRTIVLLSLLLAWGVVASQMPTD